MIAGGRIRLRNRIARFAAPACLLGLGLIAVTLPACERDAEVVNVLLISMDTTRRDHCSVYGYERRTTPTLGRMAAEGARFDLAYAPTSTTGPTHSSVFTSLYPPTHRVIKNGLTLSDELTTMAEVMKTIGYQTAAVVSSFVLDAKFGYAQGFDWYDDDFDKLESTLHVRRWEGIKIEEGFDQRADRATNKALAWLAERRDRSRPFFMFVHYFDPHSPYSPPERCLRPFRPESMTRGFVGDVARYDGEILFADNEIGRLLGEMERQGLRDNTLVVVFADHGEGLNDHGHMEHGVHVYEEVVRVPLLMRWPGHIPEGLVIEEPVELLDLAPTIVGLLGLDSEDPGWRGTDLAKAVIGRQRQLRRERPIYLYRRHYSESGLQDLNAVGEKFGLRIGDWKYIEGEEEGTLELFDLKADPAEKVNLYSDRTDRSKEMSRALHDWLDSVAVADTLGRISDEDRERLRSLGYVE